MYYIGICDDDRFFIKYIERLFLDIMDKIEFFEYLSGEELICDMKVRETYDLLILDMRMPGLDGHDTAKEFRKQFPNTLLIFVSGVCMPTVETFETTPYRYWLKEYTEERLSKEIEEVLCKVEMSKAQPNIIGKREGQIVRLRPDQVAYIAIAKRGTVLYGANLKEHYTSSKKLVEFYEQLREFGFVYAHNSYIVNLKYVIAVSKKELEFVNGEKLSISRARAKEFQKAFTVELAQKY